MPNADVKNCNLPYPGVFDPVNCDLNALIKQSAERLLPLLGEQIRVRSFCSSGLFPVVISPTRIEDIVGRLFVKAREEMRSGGNILLQTACSTIPLNCCCDSADGDVPYVMLSFKYTACEISGNHSGPMPLGGAMVQAIRNIVEESRGFIRLDCISHQETLIRIYLPTNSSLARHACESLFVEPLGKDSPVAQLIAQQKSN